MENDCKARSRGFSTDMSPEAIAKRLDLAGELYETVAWLRRFVPQDQTLEPAAGPEQDRTSDHRDDSSDPSGATTAVVP